MFFKDKMLKIIFVAVTLAGRSLASAFSNSQQVLFEKPTISSHCSSTGSISCHNDTVQHDSCCFEAPGGLLMLVQLWDTHPPTGPENSWTIHGLWGDNCDGSFEQFCDPSRNYRNLGGLLREQGADDTLDYMERYWTDLHGNNEQFWEHEWDKHGTCYSTLNPSCLPDSPKGAEAVAFFKTVVGLFQTLPSYDWLANAGILPSSERSYNRADILDALASASGAPAPVLECKKGVLNQISWYFNVQGSVIDGRFIPTDPPKGGNCPSRGIKYLPK